MGRTINVLRKKNIQHNSRMLYVNEAHISLFHGTTRMMPQYCDCHSFDDMVLIIQNTKYKMFNNTQ